MTLVSLDEKRNEKKAGRPRVPFIRLDRFPIKELLEQTGEDKIGSEAGKILALTFWHPPSATFEWLPLKCYAFTESHCSNSVLHLKGGVGKAVAFIQVLIKITHHRIAQTLPSKPLNLANKDGAAAGGGG